MNTHSTNINTTTFRATGGYNFPDLAKAFYDKHGYVVLESVYSDADLQEMKLDYGNMKDRYSQDMGMERTEYDQTINHWRDIWETEEAIRKQLFDPRQHANVRQFMGERGVQLLHDHIISKPCSTKEEALGSSTNATLPWHQDFPFWPVDTAHSLSLWTPMEDVGPEGGCLQVVPGSHRWGPQKPVDFIMDDAENPKPFQER